VAVLTVISLLEKSLTAESAEIAEKEPEILSDLCKLCG
jgi:hypothetical protein